ncbi:hypothetical protein L1987_42076 [Smallanthus sonchifolius]|uniref:Uncharacterized protein n=1 Tax=Smallanthus sonchifolius TaxID=185202 RepID=A0ACB9GX47_9ASTR|nr:hypothetical protein L1987_42076 [Smallanthus sonchifolius]
MVGASMQNMTIAELIFAMDQAIEDTIKAFAKGVYGVAIRKDDEAKVRPSARECKKVRAAEKDRKRKLAIANWDWENVVDLTNCEDEPDAYGKADDFYATDNDDLYDSDSDELADSVLCFKPNSNQSRLARRAHRGVILD